MLWGMAKYLIYGLGLILIVGLGLFMELSNGDYLIIEKLMAKKPQQVAPQAIVEK